MKRLRHITQALLWLGMGILAWGAQLRLDGIYGDSMLFQADMPVVLGGVATPGERVTAQLGAESPVQGVADSNGRWQLQLPSRAAGGPHEIVIRAGKEECRLRDVLFGELWFCAGQSNMEYAVWSIHKFWRSIGGDEAARTGENPMIRLAVTPVKNIPPGVPTGELAPVKWQRATKESITPFSAVAYYFGRELYKQRQVPVGLIMAAQGGTKIEGWISRDAIAEGGTACAKEHLALLEESKGAPLTRYPRSQQSIQWEERFYAQGGNDLRWVKADFDDTGWLLARVPTGSPLEEQLDGAVLYRRRVQLPAQWRGRELVLHLGSIDDCDDTYVNGQLVGRTGTEICGYWEVPRRYVIPAELTQSGYCQLAIRVTDFAGGGGFVSKPEALYLSCPGEEGRVSLAGEWRYKLDFQHDAKKVGRRPDPISNRQCDMPGAIFHGMVERWTQLPIRGVVWYQGESNSWEPLEYSVLFPLMIGDWRARWGQAQLPMVYAQLASYISHHPDKPFPENYWRSLPVADGSGFTLLREVQRRCAEEIPALGMAVTIDVGDQSDIHPREKITVGRRLAAEAMRLAYGYSGVTTGPKNPVARLENGAVVLKFQVNGQGLTTPSGKAPGGFALAGSDGVFHAAMSAISADGGQLRVWSPKVPQPRELRYGWRAYPGDADLYNQAGFPAGPFRLLLVP